MTGQAVVATTHCSHTEADPSLEGRNIVSPTSEEASTSAPAVRVIALAGTSITVIVAAVVLAWSGITTASGRFSASTTNESSLVTAASVDLVVDGGADVASTGLLIDADGLYPGLRLERCFDVTYRGNAGDVPVRMFGQPGGGTGLEAFIDTTVGIGTGSDHECADFVEQDSVFAGTLLDLWNRHGEFDSGLHLIDSASDGQGTWVRVTVEVVDDNDAQERTTAFWLTIEARP